MVPNSERRNAAACLLLLAALLCLPFLSGCQSANAEVLTDADRATAAADLAYVSIADRPTVWQPIDDAKPSPLPQPAPRPFTVENAVAINDGKASRVIVAPVEIAYEGSCSDGSCETYGDDYGERPRRPVVRAVGATGRAVGAIGRAINRARPIRRIGGFLFRRRCG